MSQQGYTPELIYIDVELRNADRSIAIAYYDWIQKAKGIRIEELQKVAPIGDPADCTVEQVQALNNWVLHEIQPSPADVHEIAAEWKSILRDIAIYLCESVTRQNPNAQWKISTSPPKALDFQQPVMANCATTPPYQTPAIMRAISYGYAIVHARNGRPQYGEIESKGVLLDLDDVLSLVPVSYDDDELARLFEEMLSAGE